VIAERANRVIHLKRPQVGAGACQPVSPMSERHHDAFDVLGVRFNPIADP